MSAVLVVAAWVIGPLICAGLGYWMGWTDARDKYRTATVDPQPTDETETP